MCDISCLSFAAKLSSKEGSVHRLDVVKWRNFLLTQVHHNLDIMTLIIAMRAGKLYGAEGNTLNKDQTTTFAPRNTLD